MRLRAFAIWLAIVPLAIANGALREALLTPRIGADQAHVVSCFTLSAAVLIVALLSIRWIAPAGPGQGLAIGAGWVALTLAFEFLAGRYVFGTSWSRILADYNVFAGRLWLLVLVTTGLAPFLAVHARGAASERPA
jgi:hypothetical protein